MWWLLVGLAGAQDLTGVVCPASDPDPACTHTSLAAAVGAVGPGEWGDFEVRAGTYLTENVAIVGRRVDLHAAGAVTVAGLGAQTPFSVAAGELSLVGFTITALNARALTAELGAQVSVVDGVLFTIGVSEEGGAVWVADATFEAQETLFLDNVATGSGGHLLAVDSTVTLTDCTFQGGFARDGGALVFRSDDATTDEVSIIESRLVGNLATRDGGAIAVSGPVHLQLVDSVFEDNEAERGGAIADLVGSGAAAAPTIEVRGGRFVGNDAESTGGAVALSAAVAELTDVVLRGNRSDLGGAIWVDHGAVTLTRAFACGNQALQGAAVWTGSSVEQTWSACRFVENVASGAGGAVYHGGADLVLQHGNFLGNSAVVGGVVLTSARVRLSDSLVGFTTGASAFDAPGLALIEEHHNAFYANAAGDLPPGQQRDVSDVTVDPGLRHYEPGGGCDAVDDYFGGYGPLRDAGDPYGPPDPDGTRADIGAHGGAFADTLAWSDPDGDGFPLIYDCVEGDPRFYPDADPNDGVTHDLPYDGLDFDCDGYDDFDADRDGFSLEEDCDDADPAVWPGAPELPGAGIDHNCDGRLDADLDGWDFPVDCDDGDASINPAQVEDADPLVDRDCVPPADVARPLVPASCATGAGAPGFGAALGLLLAARRRRR